MKKDVLNMSLECVYFAKQSDRFAKYLYFHDSYLYYGFHYTCKLFDFTYTNPIIFPEDEFVRIWFSFSFEFYLLGHRRQNLLQKQSFSIYGQNLAGTGVPNCCPWQHSVCR